LLFTFFFSLSLFSPEKHDQLNKELARQKSNVQLTSQYQGEVKTFRDWLQTQKTASASPKGKDYRKKSIEKNCSYRKEN